MTVPGTKRPATPIGTYYEPPPDGNPLLKGKKIGHSIPVQALNRFQRTSDRLADFIDEILPF